MDGSDAVGCCDAKGCGRLLRRGPVWDPKSLGLGL